MLPFRNYFSFYNYEYYLDVSKAYNLMQDVKPLNEGLKEALDWYIKNIDQVNKKSFIDYIDRHL